MKCGAIKYDDKLLDKKEAASEKKEREQKWKERQSIKAKKVCHIHQALLQQLWNE